MSLRPKSHNVLYTTPEDEDSFPPQVHVAPLGHHTSSMANVWINNHHSTLPSSASIIQADFTSGTTCSQGPRLPASHLAAAQEDLVTLNSFDMLDDLEIPPRVQDSEAAYTTSTGRRSWGHSMFTQTSSSLRSLRLSFLAGSPSNMLLAKPPATTLSRTSSNLAVVKKQQVEEGITVSPGPTIEYPRPTSKWRPTILGYFAAHPATEEKLAPPRASMSSGDTYSSTTTTTLTNTTTTVNDILVPPKPTQSDTIRPRNLTWNNFKLAQLAKFDSFDSVRLRSITSPPNPLHQDDSQADSSSTLAQRRTSASSRSSLPFSLKSKVPHPSSNPNPCLNDGENQNTNHIVPSKQRTRPEVAYVSISKRISFTSLSSRKKHRKLIVSGIAPNDTRRFEGVKRWCESFGEVNQITRMPNGDLHVHFRRADVAETVCRVRAKVHITGVGSVQLSWYTGDKR